MPRRLALAAAYGSASAALFYALARVAERAILSEPNPAALVWSEKSPFVWRAAIALELGGAAAFGAFVLAARAPALARGSLSWLVTAAAFACALMAMLFP